MTYQIIWSFSVASYSLSTTEKTKENEHVESHDDGSIAFLSVNSVPVESENHEVTDVEQLRRKSPDEVCVTKYDVMSQMLASKNKSIKQPLELGDFILKTEMQHEKM